MYTDGRLPRLVAFDLDGTLLDPGKLLTARTAAALQALAARGTICVLASGRMYRNCMEPYVADLALGTPVICYNGAVILDPATGRIVSEKPVPPEVGRQVIDFAAETGRTLNIYHEDVLYCREETEWTRLYCGRTTARPTFRDDLYEWFGQRISTKLLILDHPPIIEQLCAQWQQRLDGQLYVTISDPEYLEFMNPGASKGWALRTVCEQLGVDPADTAAFGDARNDMPLLQAAGYGVAMANARPELQAVADEIAPGNDVDGVAQVIERWLS